MRYFKTLQFLLWAAAVGPVALTTATVTHASGEMEEVQSPPPATSYTPSREIQGKGTKEIELSGGFLHAQGSDVGTINADIGFGYYVAPRLALGIRQSLSYSFIDEASDTWTASTIPFLDYSFRLANPNFRPFIGAFAGAVYNEDDITGTIGPAVGFRHFLNESTAIVTRYRYEWFFDKLSFEDAAETSDGNHVVTLGFSYSW